MAVKLTEKAAEEVKKFMGDHKCGPESMLRIGIGAGGCSGFEYMINLTDDIDDDSDVVYEMHGVNVVVNRKHALYLDETTVDFYDGIDRRGFDFINPAAAKSCGCGRSFQA